MPAPMHRAQAVACTHCGSTDTIPVIYGYPGPGTRKAMDRGELILGGCVVVPGQPSHVCQTCHQGFREPAQPDRSA